MPLHVEPEIQKAKTLHTDFYNSPQFFEASKDKIFARSWHFLGDAREQLPLPGSLQPIDLLPKFLDEPLLLSHDKTGQMRLLSNVCTHRGNLLINQPQRNAKHIVCHYHGRRFSLGGECRHMPCFEGVEGFPSQQDNLHNLPLTQLGNLLFGALTPSFDFEEEVLEPIHERVGFLPFENMREDSTLGRDYLVKAHWALYCENYLEGFHIPFVHPDLNAALDFKNYRYELGKYYNLQIGVAKNGEDCFDLPEGHPEYGQNIAAYYYWVFPNLMFNFYPWGLSINLIEPLGLSLTKVKFRGFVHDPSRLGQGAGGDLDKVEREDEEVVERVQRGVRSRFYQHGRFSPEQEQGVHHFQQLIADFMQ